MRLTAKEIDTNLNWFDQLKINPHPRVAGDLAIRALKDLKEINEGLEKLHDEIYEGSHREDCDVAIWQMDEVDCDCGFEVICKLLGIES